MPHLIIESSRSLTSNVVEELHQTVGQQETVAIEAVKTRLYSPAISFSGSNVGEAHTAITLKLLSGRSPQLKETMASNIFDKARQLIPEGSLSVDVIDLGVYKK